MSGLLLDHSPPVKFVKLTVYFSTSWKRRAEKGVPNKRNRDPRRGKRKKNLWLVAFFGVRNTASGPQVKRCHHSRSGVHLDDEASAAEDEDDEDDDDDSDGRD